ncbi:MAG: protein-L-isoaspartate O-methyltransferase [Gracilibacter sp. BRH_c7a]|nr:MAG: protein-L-isoaspartate O-methyltransferase [Gracilibacter sp. BRH_c7a]
MEKWEVLAEELVDKSLEPEGIKDTRILQAISKIPRHLFVPQDLEGYAYNDSPLPIGGGQTISQPFIVARMTELMDLKDGDKVLEIGTGSGYQAAVLHVMGMKVTTIERIEDLAVQARKIFKRLSYDIHSIIDDGREGYLSDAPYNAVIVTAGALEVEGSWLSQVVDGGKIVVPLYIKEGVECLLVRQKRGQTYEDTWYDYCRFVPLLPGVIKKE